MKTTQFNLSFCLIFLLSLNARAQWTSSGANAYFNLSGNVGIGTTTPGSKLEVTGMIESRTAGQAGLHLYNGGSNSEWYIHQKSQTNHNLYITRVVASQQMDYLTFNPNGSSSFFYPVGIGTANPAGPGLTLGGASAPNPNTGAELDYSGLNLTFRSESQGQNFNLGTIKMVQPSGNFFDNADMVFLTCLQNPTEKMRIKGSGNVGIGTSNPQNKLDVNGTIHSKVVKVDMDGWSDYVFEDSYKLPSLSAIKNFIGKNHRLPDVPSAEEVVKNGQNLGEMNKILLKKVEELTLHLIKTSDNQIRQKLQINEQRNQIYLLKKQMDLLLKEKVKSGRHH